MVSNHPLDRVPKPTRMAAELFRQEVLEARRASGLGGVSLAQPLQWWLLTLAGTVAAGSIIVFLIPGDIYFLTAPARAPLLG